MMPLDVLRYVAQGLCKFNCTAIQSVARLIVVMRYLIVGGAGFIGSHIVNRLLTSIPASRVTVYDNFSSGQEHYLTPFVEDPRLQVVRADAKDLAKLTEAMVDQDVVYHFAANPDIAKAMRQPDIDFWEGTYLTQNVLEAMRINRVSRLIYASGSGVYGEGGLHAFAEDHGPMQPISTYGASKLACEALICAYGHLFGLTARCYRFANVVGPRQTHGVGFDFIRRLRANSRELEILGDGTQSKSYIYVDDILDAIWETDARSERLFDCFNVATGDYITVREIADIVVEEMGLAKGSVEYRFTGGDRGWKGDVPVVRFDLVKIHNMSWRAKRTSTQAIRESVRAMLAGT